jgi:hypothetical protein
MKSTVKLYITGFTAMVMLFSSCTHVLEEHPKDRLTPDYFQTPQGVTSGLTAAYSYFRFYYATQGGMNLSVFGTDEFTHGSELNNPPLNIYTGINSSNGDVAGPWNRAYPAINTCNGVIEYGEKSTALSDAQKTTLLAEAKFLRAQWYFILVQTFGAVTLDLGSGPLKFNVSPSNVASRAPIADVYDAIIKDANEAAQNLPDRPAAQGRVWKASALHLLAKAYLTRGWSSAAQASDFQNAYNAAKQLIDNKNTYGVDLLPDYADVHRQGNEYSKEALFQVDWIDNTQYNNNNAFGVTGDDGVRQNVSLFLFRCRYIDLPGMIRDVTNGRPFVRYKPTPWLLDNAFADKVNDSRYYKSFQTVWLANTTATIPVWTQADVDAGNVSADKLNKPKFNMGDTAAWMVPKHLEAQITPLKDKKGYRVFLPTEVNGQNKFFPTLKKFDATQGRANNDPNIASVRPFIVYRFAETYLIAAEAAFKLGQVTDAANYINVVRTRAAANAGAIPAMTANTEADLTAGGIDYILDERARELCGEQMRWFDLTRTGKLLDRVKAFNAQAGPGIQSFHTLRPIPQPQIDGSVDPSSSDSKYPQNGGY